MGKFNPDQASLLAQLVKYKVVNACSNPTFEFNCFHSCESMSASIYRVSMAIFDGRYKDQKTSLN